MPWVKGESGNPSGKPKEDAAVRQAKELARAKCPAAVNRLIELMASSDEKVSLAACNSVLDRGIGKPLQAVEHTSTGGFFDMLAMALVTQQAGVDGSGTETGASEGGSGSIQ